MCSSPPAPACLRRASSWADLLAELVGAWLHTSGMAGSLTGSSALNAGRLNAMSCEVGWLRSTGMPMSLQELS